MRLRIVGYHIMNFPSPEPHHEWTTYLLRQGGRVVKALCSGRSSKERGFESLPCHFFLISASAEPLDHQCGRTRNLPIREVWLFTAA